MQSEKSASDSGCVCGRKKFAQLQNQTLRYEQLTDLPVLCLEKNTSTRNYVDGFLEKNGVALSPEFELATSNILIQFARKGLGIASVVKDFAEEFLETGELFLLDFEDQIPAREFCVVTDQRIPVSAAAGKLLEMIEKEDIRSIYTKYNKH